MRFYLVKRVLLALALLANPAGACEGYFCDKYFDTMHIVMTHNSLAIPGKVLSPNQNYNIVRQFEDGIRGLNFDLYSKNAAADDYTLWTFHGDEYDDWLDMEFWADTEHTNDDWLKDFSVFHGYNPSSVITELVAKMNEDQYRNEFIYISLQDGMGSDTTVQSFVDLFGDLIVTDFDSSNTLGHYIDLNQRVYIVSNTAYPHIDGMHDSNSVANHYEWSNCHSGRKHCNLEENKWNEETNVDQHTMVKMNHFCQAIGGVGDMISSEVANAYYRILYDARAIIQEPWATSGEVNIINVDYYETGDVFRAQAALRDGNYCEGCIEDGKKCVPGISNAGQCFRCETDHHEFWESQLFTACGEEPCWVDGKLCGVGTTCDNNCCNGSEWWTSKAFTACGKEPKQPNGKACLLNDDCESGNCDVLFICQAKVGYGKTCNQDSDCSGMKCLSKKCSDGRTGGSCSQDSHCDTGRCSSKICKTKIQTGNCSTQCGSNSDCASNKCLLRSARKYCAATNGKMPDGCSCDSGGNCESGRCEGSFPPYRCEETLKKGAKCNENSDCTSGTCKKPAFKANYCT